MPSKRKVTDIMYFSIHGNLQAFCEKVYLGPDEVEEIVGRFAAHSCRAGRLRGKGVFYADGGWQIRKCFGNQLLFDEIEGLVDI